MAKPIQKVELVPLAAQVDDRDPRHAVLSNLDALCVAALGSEQRWTGGADGKVKRRLVRADWKSIGQLQVWGAGILGKRTEVRPRTVGAFREHIGVRTSRDDKPTKLPLAPPEDRVDE